MLRPEQKLYILSFSYNCEIQGKLFFVANGELDHPFRLNRKDEDDDVLAESFMDIDDKFNLHRLFFTSLSEAEQEELDLTQKQPIAFALSYELKKVIRFCQFEYVDIEPEKVFDIRTRHVGMLYKIAVGMPEAQKKALYKSLYGAQKLLSKQGSRSYSKHDEPRPEKAKRYPSLPNGDKGRPQEFMRFYGCVLCCGPSLRNLPPQIDTIEDLIRQKTGEILSEIRGILGPRNPSETFLQGLIYANWLLSRGTKVSDEELFCANRLLRDEHYWKAYGNLAGQPFPLGRSKVLESFQMSVSGLSSVLSTCRFDKRWYDINPELSKTYVEYYRRFTNIFREVCEALEIAYPDGGGNEFDLIWILNRIDTQLLQQLNTLKTAFTSLNLLSVSEATRSLRTDISNYIGLEDGDLWVYFLSGHIYNGVEYNRKIVWTGTAKDLVVCFATIDATKWKKIETAFVDPSGEPFKEGTLKTLKSKVLKNIHASETSQEIELERARVNTFYSCWNTALKEPKRILRDLTA